MTIAARFAGLFRLLTASASPGHVPSFQRASADTFLPALPTAPTPSADGLAQLQARRQALLAEAARQKNLRRSRQASLTEADLRAVTHQILSTRTPRHA